MTRCLLFLWTVLATSAQMQGQIRVLGIRSSANFEVGRLYPGSLASIFCTGLQNIPTLLVAQDQPLPRELAGVRVIFTNNLAPPQPAIEAPILAIANIDGTLQQINLQVPWELARSTTAPAGFIPATPVALNSPGFEVVQNNIHAQGIYEMTPQSWPVFFVDGSGYVLARHAVDYRVVTPADPATRDEWIMVYATNLGAVDHTPADGATAQTNPLSPVATATWPSFTYFFPAFSGNRLVNNYMGLAPNTVGVYQVNIRVPGGQPDGDANLQLVYNYDCGFFFVHGCGRGNNSLISVTAKLPVGRVPIAVVKP